MDQSVTNQKGTANCISEH